MSEYLFAYGTLMSTETTDAARRLKAEADLIGAASTGGRLFDQGRWPGLIPCREPHEMVHGELWQLRSQASLAWLDAYEGIKPDALLPEYARELIRVQLLGGTAHQAWGYVYQWPVQASDCIASGRWQDRRSGPIRNGPSLALPRSIGRAEMLA